MPILKLSFYPDKKHPIFLLIVVLLLTTTIDLYADHVQNVVDPNTLLTIDTGLEVFEDATDALSFEAIRKKKFEKLDGISPYRGIKIGAVWIKFTIENSSNLSQLLLLLEEPVLDRVELFQVKSGGSFSSILIDKGRPFDERKYNDPNYLFDLTIPQGSREVIYLKINSKSIIHTPLYLGATQSILEKLKIKHLWYNIYMGLMIGLIMYNFFIFLSTKQNVYLQYLIYMLMVLFAQITVQGGYAFQYLWPNIPYIATHSVYIFPVLSGITAVEFVRVFLQTKKNCPQLNKYFLVFEIIYIVCLLAAFAGFYSIPYRVIEVNAIAVSFYLIWVGVVLLINGNREAKFFLLAWTFFLGGVTIFVSKEVGILPYSNWTKYAMPVGSAIEAMLLSLALADRLNFFKRAKENAENETKELFEKFKENLSKESKLERENYELRMANLRSQMNPHFVFNSLGSIQYYIQTNKVEEADDYLTKFAQLMRGYLDSSIENEISIRKEVALLKDYIALEQMRFDHKFSLRIEVDASLDQDALAIPTMLIQPIVENAINHGLQSRRDNNGELNIYFNQIGEGVQCVIRDNGVGVDFNSTQNKKSYISRSTQNIKDRVVVFKNLGKADIKYEINQMAPGDIFPGTEVRIIIHYLDAQ